MMLIRAKFCKLDPVRYISHLELMGTLRQAFRRAELPVAFSQGYNPRIKLSMGQPLSVGMIGHGEYFDLELKEKVEIDDFSRRVNQSLPAGIRILEAREVRSEVKSLQAIADTAVYLINMEFNNEPDESSIIDDFYGRDEIRITRHRRNKEDRVLDLRPMIYEIELSKPGQWKFVVSTGSRGNVRATELIRALAARYEEIKEVPIINVEREGLFVSRDRTLYKPFAKKVVGGD